MRPTSPREQLEERRVRATIALQTGNIRGKCAGRVRNSALRTPAHVRKMVVRTGERAYAQCGARAYDGSLGPHQDPDWVP